MAASLAFSVAPELAAVIRGAAGEDPEIALTEGELLQRAGAVPEAIDLVVIGPGAEHPVRIAQRLRSVNGDVPVLIVARPSQVAEERRLLRYASFVGQDVQLVAADDAAVDGLARDAVARARDRRRYRSSRELLRTVVPREHVPARPRSTPGARPRTDVLARASARLGEAHDLDGTCAAIADAVIPEIGDVCLVDLVEPDGTVRRYPPAHASHLPADAVAGLARYAPRPGGPQPASEAIRSYRAVLHPVIDDARLERILIDPEHIAIARRIQARSSITVPLVARGRLVGTITVIGTAGRPSYTEADLALVTEIGQRAAPAIEGARMFDAARAAADAERRARADAEEAARMRDVFLSIASHELRTPLAALVGRIQLAQRRLDRDGTDPEAMRTTLARLGEQAARLARLVDQLLDVSRIEFGKLELERAPADLVRVLQEATDVARHGSETHHWQLDAPAELTANVDAPRVEQVMIALLGNAARFSPEGTTITASLARDGDDVVLAVEDEGPGIPPEDRERIFERFQQLHRRGGGIGLGLYVTREIVRRHGGTIAVEEAPGGGARFVVRLPAPASGHTAATEPAAGQLTRSP